MKRINMLLIVSLLMSTSSEAKILNQVSQGKKLFKRLYTNKEAEVSVNLQSIANIMHFLYSKVPSKNNGNGFLSGNIIIQDPDYKLFDYLRSYVEKKYSGDMCVENFVSQINAYPRTSSHFNEYYVYTKKAKKNWFGGVTKTDCDYVHYGIDMVDNVQLPIQEKKHILFGKIGTIKGKQFMFVKFEEVGVQGMQVIQHMFNFIKKYFSESSNQSPTDYRREDVPKKIMQKFVSLINSAELALSKKRRQKIIKKTKTLGIRTMIHVALKYQKIEQMKLFTNKLQQRYPDWQYRFGNEIILFHKELV